jgi:hypothetical protein
MSNKNFDFQISWNLRFPPLEPETSSLFWLDTSVDIVLTGQLYDKLISVMFVERQTQILLANSNLLL